MDLMTLNANTTMYEVGSDCRLTLSCDCLSASHLGSRAPRSGPTPWTLLNKASKSARVRRSPETSEAWGSRYPPTARSAIADLPITSADRAVFDNGFRSPTRSSTSVGRERLREAQAARLSAAEDVLSLEFWTVLVESTTLDCLGECSTAR